MMAFSPQRVWAQESETISLEIVLNFPYDGEYLGVTYDWICEKMDGHFSKKIYLHEGTQFEFKLNDVRYSVDSESEWLNEGEEYSLERTNNAIGSTPKTYKSGLYQISISTNPSNVISFEFIEPVDGVYYNLDEENLTAEVTNCRGDCDYEYYDRYVPHYSGVITIPDCITVDGTEYTVTSIEEAAFQDCHSMTSVTIPNTVTSIKNATFKSCFNLSSVTIPNTVASIGESAFNMCAFTSITIPSSVTSIDESAFCYCEKLEEVFCLSEPAPAIGTDAFEGISEEAVLYVMPGCYDDYVNKGYGSYFSQIVTGEPFNLTDADPGYADRLCAVGQMTYTRGSSAPAAGSYATFCMPFDVDLSQAACIGTAYVPLDIAFYNEGTGMLNLFFHEVTDIIPAGTPFVARMSGQPIQLANCKNKYPGEVDPELTYISVFNYTGTAGLMLENESMCVTFGGALERLEGSNFNTFNTNGSFGRSSYVSPFRVFVEIEKEGPAEVKAVNAIFGDEDNMEDYIEAVKAGELPTTGEYYTIDGLKTSQPKGLYIYNGKKYLKK